MILFQRASDDYLKEIVEQALRRSFSVSLVSSCIYGEEGSLPECAVLLNPDSEHYPLFKKLKGKGRKILLLGSLPPEFASDLGIHVEPLSAEQAAWGEVSPSPAWHHCDVSFASVHYEKDHPLGAASPLNIRHFARYDFTDEWNNMGYGRIMLDNTVWSLSSVVHANGTTPIASVYGPGGEPLSLYASVTDFRDSSVLWFNRSAGPVDSLEWRVIERFFSEYRGDTLPCLPCISEIPFGYSCAATMRLDCDQDVGSARNLFEFYRERELAFSLALLTGLEFSDDDISLMRDTSQAGGSLLIHSHGHLPDWGGSYEASRADMGQALEWMKQHFPEVSPVFAVAPFHQTPPYAVRAMADAGIRAFVGGIIHNDPEYLLGRAGRVPFMEGTVVSHSQQCMLHGDCYHRYGNTAEPYIRSFNNHVASRSIFGYLDHPFSAQYRYGWHSEEERMGVHRELLDHICSHDGLWWCNTAQCLSFLLKRDTAEVHVEKDGLRVMSQATEGLPGLAVEYRGMLFREGQQLA